MDIYTVQAWFGVRMPKSTFTKLNPFFLAYFSNHFLFSLHGHVLHLRTLFCFIVFNSRWIIRVNHLTVMLCFAWPVKSGISFDIFAHVSVIYEIQQEITKFKESFEYFNGLLQCLDLLIMTTIFLIHFPTPLPSPRSWSSVCRLL